MKVKLKLEDEFGGGLAGLTTLQLTLQSTKTLHIILINNIKDYKHPFLKYKKVKNYNI